MQRSFTIVSIGAHSIVIAAALYAQLVADSALPSPHQPVLFDSARFMPIDIHVPKAPVGPVSTSKSAPTNAAPVVAPSGVIEETGHESDPTPPVGTMIPGVESGPPSSFDGIKGAGVALVPPPAPEPTAPMRLHSGMKTPVKVTDVPPVYPEISRRAHIQGVVILEAVLDAKGAVTAVHVLRSVPTLDQAAVDAVQQWRFTPALLNGQPVPVVMTVTVNFTLQDR